MKQHLWDLDQGISSARGDLHLLCLYIQIQQQVDVCSSPQCSRPCLTGLQPAVTQQAPAGLPRAVLEQELDSGMLQGPFTCRGGWSTQPAAQGFGVH